MAASMALLYAAQHRAAYHFREELHSTTRRHRRRTLNISERRVHIVYLRIKYGAMNSKRGRR